jgi:predicted protein tyrosine phosphatase
MKVTTYSMNEFLVSKYTDDNVDEFVDSKFICIHSQDWVHSLAHFDRPHNNVLSITFDDTDCDCIKSVEWFDGSQKMFAAYKITPLQAKEILDFVGDCEDVHVYCAKGKSRSTAVAKYLLDRKKKNSKHIREFNYFVYTVLREANVQDKKA